MVIILFIFFLFLFLRYKNKNGNTKVLLCFYLLSGFVSTINYIFQIKIDEPINDFAVLYYLICLYLLLFPFLKNGQFTYENYNFPPKLVKFLSWILIISCFINLTYSISELINSVTSYKDFLDLRAGYYHDIHNQIHNYENKSLIHIFSNVLLYISYLCPIFCFYYIIKGNKKFAIMLCISSLANPIDRMIIGEREACLVVISNYIFAYYFFRNSFSSKIKKKIKFILILVAISLGGFIILMTFLRFSDYIGESLVIYR